MLAIAVTGLLIGELAAFSEHNLAFRHSFTYGEEYSRRLRQGGVVAVGNKVDEPCFVGLIRCWIVVFDTADQHGHNALSEIGSAIKSSVVNSRLPQYCAVRKVSGITGKNRSTPNTGVTVYSLIPIRQIVAKFFSLLSRSVNDVSSVDSDQSSLCKSYCGHGMSDVFNSDIYRPRDSAFIEREIVGWCNSVLYPRAVGHFQLALHLFELSLHSAPLESGYGGVSYKANQSQNLNEEFGFLETALKFLKKVIFCLIIVGLIIFGLGVIHCEVPYRDSFKEVIVFVILGLGLIISAFVLAFLVSPLVF